MKLTCAAHRERRGCTTHETSLLWVNLQRDHPTKLRRDAWEVLIISSSTVGRNDLGVCMRCSKSSQEKQPIRTPCSRAILFLTACPAWVGRYMVLTQQAHFFGSSVLSSVAARAFPTSEHKLQATSGCKRMQGPIVRNRSLPLWRQRGSKTVCPASLFRDTIRYGQHYPILSSNKNRHRVTGPKTQAASSDSPTTGGGRNGYASPQKLRIYTPLLRDQRSHTFSAYSAM